MEALYAVSVGFVAGLLWAQVAVAGGPVMPCETGGTLHLTKQAAPECSGGDCSKLVAASNIGKEATEKQ